MSLRKVILMIIFIAMLTLSLILTIYLVKRKARIVLMPKGGRRELVKSYIDIVIILLAVSTAMYVIVKKLGANFMIALVACALIFLSYVTSYNMLIILNARYTWILLALILLTICWVSTLLKEVEIVSSILVEITGVLTGLTMMLSLPVYLLILFIITLIIYDYISVRYWLLREVLKNLKIEEKTSREKHTTKVPLPLRLIMANIGYMYIGIGDIIVFTILVSSSYVMFPSIIPSIFVIISIIAGLMLTKFLMKVLGWSYAPGLPIPVTLALIVFIVSKVVL